MNIESIKPYPKNAKKHEKKQIQQVANSIKRFGFIQPIVIDKNNEIVIGHCRFEAAKLLDLKEVPTISVENLTDKEVQALRIADNKLNESAWDMNLVIDDLKGLDSELFDLTGFDKDLLIEPDEKDDEIPENVPAKSKLGDLYELGSHRVLCGDSTQPEAVLRLMDGKKADCVVSDPPYNTGMEGKPNDEKARLSHMFKDNFTEPEYIKLITDFIKNSFDNSKGECAFYIFIDWRRGGANQRNYGNFYAC